MNFNEKYFKLLIETSLNLSYDPSKAGDMKKVLADFYMLVLLKTSWNIRSEDIRYEKYQEDLNKALQDTSNILLPYIKHILLEVVYDSIISEMLHTWESSDAEFPDGYEEYLKKQSLEIQSMYKSFYANLEKAHEERETLKDYYDILDDGGGNMTLDRKKEVLDVVNQYVIGEESKELFVKFSKFAFTDTNFIEWEQDYAGPAWGKICDAWEQLNNSKSDKDIILAIDNVVDMQHNTGTVFNKTNTFSVNRDSHFMHSWIEPFLNFKANIQSNTEVMYLYTLCSRQMQRIAEIRLRQMGFSQSNIEKKEELSKILKISDTRILELIESRVQKGFFFISNSGEINIINENYHELDPELVDENGKLLVNFNVCYTNFNIDTPFSSFKGFPKVVYGDFTVNMLKFKGNSLDGITKTVNKGAFFNGAGKNLWHILLQTNKFCKQLTKTAIEKVLKAKEGVKLE